jgi:hypothetical protein
MRAEGPDPADLDLAGLTRLAPAVTANPDGLVSVVLVAVGHAGEIDTALRSVNTQMQI